MPSLPSRRRPRLEVLEDRAVPAAIAPPAGIVSWWTGDNTTADLKGSNNGTLNNGAGYATGNVAGAFNVDGVDDYVQAATAGLPTGNADRTLELWVKLDSLPTSGEAYFAGYGNFGTSTQTYHLGSTGPNLFWSQWGTGIGGPALLPNRWYHVAVTNVGNSATLYLDGVAVGSNTVTIATPAGSPFYIGKIPGANGDIRKLDGAVDEVTVYNRALTAAEIQRIYNAGPDGKIKSPNYFAADFPIVAEPAAGATGTATFTISRVGSTTGQATVDWATADGTATAGADYVAASGQVVFQDGESQKTVQVTLNGDDSPEPSESFRLVLSTTTPGYAVAEGVATITDQNIAVSVADASAVEADFGFGSLGALVHQSANGGLNRSLGMAWGPDGNLYIGSQITDEVLRFDGTTGAFLGAFVSAGSGGLNGPAVQGLHFRPDGKLYVLNRDTPQVLRYDATTGAFIDVFIPAGSGGLAVPKGMTVGPDGNWYVSNSTNEILRYSGTTGAFMGAFVAAGSGGLDGPRGLVFGPDGNLYVASTNTNAVLRYHGTTGAFLGVHVAAGSSGLSAPGELLFHAGSLYVSSQFTNQVLRYDAATGAPLDVAVAAGLGGLDRPIGLLFDSANNLLVSSYAEILRYAPGATAVFTVQLATPSLAPVTVNFTTADGTALAGTDYTPTSGTVTFSPGQTVKSVAVPLLFDAVAEAGETFTLTLSNPYGAYIADGLGVATVADDDGPKTLAVNDVSVIEGDSGTQLATFTVTLSAASGQTVTVNFATANGTATAGSDYTAASGTLTFVPGETSKTVSIAVVGDTTVEATETFVVNLTAPTNATLGDGQGVGTITDNDATKYFVVDDASPDRTYRYGSLGNAQANSSLTAANTAPRGVASNAAGDKLWVIDVNKTVYVYNAAGTLLGSWTAGTLAANAQVEDIATNGTDIWIVDAKQDKVFRYTNAASRLSGSQTAASSFNLASGNTGPKGIVTDGTSLWVVNDSTTTIDKVFKYSLTGTLLGSWTIDAANATPTGITLDPTAPNHLWIVDNGTDRVYQYDAAVGRTSGSQAASGSFALAAGNTNPQGIADPPPAARGSLVPVALPSRKQAAGLGARAAALDWLYSRAFDGGLATLLAALEGRRKGR